MGNIVTTCRQCGQSFQKRNGHHVFCGCRCRESSHRKHDRNALDVRIWEGVEIQRRPADGYVNATAMCKAGGRRWNHYQANDRTEGYIAALAADAGIPATGNPGLIDSIKGGRPELQGTWIHPRLAVDLARWISPAFAVWMDGWFLDVAAKGRTAQPQAQALPANPAPRRRQVARADGPTRITWGDRLVLVDLARQAQQIDERITRILQSGVLSE